MKHLIYVPMVSVFLLFGPTRGLDAAELKLASVFADHMVLQREKSVPVWGWADADEAVTITFSDQKQVVTANADGMWMARLAPMNANPQPQPC